LLVFTTAIVQLLDYFITLPTLFDLKWAGNRTLKVLVQVVSVDLKLSII
jgi:hypothetical protein